MYARQGESWCMDRHSSRRAEQTPGKETSVYPQTAPSAAHATAWEFRDERRSLMRVRTNEGMQRHCALRFERRFRPNRARWQRHGQAIVVRERATKRDTRRRPAGNAAGGLSSVKSFQKHYTRLPGTVCLHGTLNSESAETTSDRILLLGFAFADGDVLVGTDVLEGLLLAARPFDFERGYLFHLVA